MNMIVAELEHEIKQNKAMITYVAKNINDYTADLQNMVASGDYDQSASRNWTDGHVSEDVTRLASLIQKHQALQMALNIVKKGEQE